LTPVLAPVSRPRGARGRTRRAALAVGVALLVLAPVAGAPVEASPVASHAAGPKKPAKHKPKPACGHQKLPAKPGGGHWVCTFNDEFGSARLDRSKWVVDRTTSNGLHVGPSCLTDSARTVSQAKGILTLSVVDTGKSFRCAAPRKPFNTRYVAGSVNTYKKFKQLYGRFEVRARFPGTTVRGLVSSFWLFPFDQNTSSLAAAGDTGEIDIAEHYTQYADRSIPYAHAVLVPSGQRTKSGCKIANPGQFHTYVLVWTKTQIKIVYDGITCMNLTNWVAAPSPFDTADMVALSTGVGTHHNSPTAATPFPARTQIDYVRVWK